MRCLTIESEERETWTAVSLRGCLKERSYREITDCHTYLKHTIAGAEMRNAIVLGTRRENVTSQASDLIQLESLILAQNERWRQA